MVQFGPRTKHISRRSTGKLSVGVRCMYRRAAAVSSVPRTTGSKTVWRSTAFYWPVPASQHPPAPAGHRVGLLRFACLPHLCHASPSERRRCRLQWFPEPYYEVVAASNAVNLPRTRWNLCSRRQMLSFVAKYVQRHLHCILVQLHFTIGITRF